MIFLCDTGNDGSIIKRRFGTVPKHTVKALTWLFPINISSLADVIVLGYSGPSINKVIMVCRGGKTNGKSSSKE